MKQRRTQLYAMLLARSVALLLEHNKAKSRRTNVRQKKNNRGFEKNYKEKIDNNNLIKLIHKRPIIALLLILLLGAVDVAHGVFVWPSHFFLLICKFYSHNRMQMLYNAPTSLILYIPVLHFHIVASALWWCWIFVVNRLTLSVFLVHVLCVLRFFFLLSFHSHLDVCS